MHNFHDMKKLIFPFLLICLSRLTAQIGINDYLNSTISAVPFINIPTNAVASGLQKASFSSTGISGSIYENTAAIPFGKPAMHLQLNYQFFNPYSGNIPLFITAEGFKKINSVTCIAGGVRILHLPVVSFGTGPHLDELKEFTIDGGVARKWDEHFSAGVNLHYIQSNAAGTYHTGSFTRNLAADLTTEFQYPITMGSKPGHFNFAIGAFHLGNKMIYTYTTAKDFIPAVFKAGTSVEFSTFEGQKMIIAVMMDKLLIPTPDTTDSDNSGIYDFQEESAASAWFTSFYDAPGGFVEELKEIRYHGGVQYDFYDQFYVRTGYYFESRVKGGSNIIAAGVGIRVFDFQLDAAYTFPINKAVPEDDRRLLLSLAWDI